MEDSHEGIWREAEDSTVFSKVRVGKDSEKISTGARKGLREVFIKKNRRKYYIFPKGFWYSFW